MKKVGIMSMQRVCNYGSFLQAYALKSLIENLDCEVEFVDYRVEKCKINSPNDNNFLYKLYKSMEYFKLNAPFVSTVKFILLKKNYGKKYYKLLGIKNEYNYTPQLDVLIIGSDEVFNCIQSNPNVGYSMELFGKNNNAKKLVSYAGSFGNTTIEKLKKYNAIEEVKNYLLKFDSISVRDRNSYNIVEKLTSEKPEINLDPVLIYDYMNDCSVIPSEIKDKNYIIVYAYPGRMSEHECNLIRKYAQKNKKKVFCIGGIQKVCDKLIDCSPFEVLAYFKNADAIITDTFHGSIFSIITQRKFVTIIRKSNGLEYGNEEKLTYLLEKLNLTSRKIDDILELEDKLKEEVDFEATYEILEDERIKAKNYLKKVLLG